MRVEWLIQIKQQVPSIHMTNFIISCPFGGWSGIWGFCATPFLLRKNMYKGTMGRPMT